jgi:carbon-monoxide dehydrogenase large subunit
MTSDVKTKQGVGASLLRKEDDRYMRGRGQYVADVKLPGMKDVAFLRSPLAHARINNIVVPEHLKDRTYCWDDMDGVKAIRATTSLPGFKASEQPPLATGKVRQVGELVAMCIGGTTRGRRYDGCPTIRIRSRPRRMGQQHIP